MFSFKGATSQQIDKSKDIEYLISSIIVQSSNKFRAKSYGPDCFGKKLKRFEQQTLVSHMTEIHVG